MVINVSSESLRRRSASSKGLQRKNSLHAEEQKLAKLCERELVEKNVG
jgi:hypothetical protein